MSQINCEMVMQYLPVYVAILMIVLAIFIIKYVSKEPDEQVVEKELEDQDIEDSRYVFKKPSRSKNDTNRFARWKLLKYNGREKVVVGYLSNILENHTDVKRYKEIK